MSNPSITFDEVLTSPFGPPKCSGVYAVCVKETVSSKERILYIGSSQNVFIRVNNNEHWYYKCYQRFNDKIVYTKTIETENFKELEIELIRYYKPLLNKMRYDG